MKFIVSSLFLTTMALPMTSADAPRYAAPITEISKASHPEASPFDAKANADAELAMILSKAKASGKMPLIVLGANWCHDSRALAGWFATPRFQQLLKARYEPLYIDIGKPQSGAGRNLHIPKKYGLKAIKGTPTVMILSSEGKLLNKNNAPSWRNAASRSEGAIYQYFARFTPP